SGRLRARDCRRAADDLRAPRRTRRGHRPRRVRGRAPVARGGDERVPGDVAVTGFDARLEALGLVLPGPYPPHDPLDAVIVHGARARTSGQLPRDHAGALVHPGVLGVGLTVEQGAEAARWCALNALSVLRAELGSLDRVERVLTMLGFV